MHRQWIARNSSGILGGFCRVVYGVFTGSIAASLEGFFNSRRCRYDPGATPLTFPQDPASWVTKSVSLGDPVGSLWRGGGGKEEGGKGDLMKLFKVFLPT